MDGLCQRLAPTRSAQLSNSSLLELNDTELHGYTIYIPQVAILFNGQWEKQQFSGMTLCMAPYFDSDPDILILQRGHLLMSHKLPDSPPETGAYSVLIGTALFFVIGGWTLVGGPLTGSAVRNASQWI